jgi:uncharacterized membrane protein
MNKKDDSLQEILKRLESINYRLNSIEQFLKVEKEEKPLIRKIPEEKKEEAAYLIEETKEEQETLTPETPIETIETEEKPVSASDQERIWFSVLHVIGIFALAIGVGLFIKFTLPYFGPWHRISIGWIIGVGLLYLGEKLTKKYGTYALGISSCGIVILYFSFYAASAFYGLFSPTMAFLFMLLVTVLGVLLSLRYDSSIISFIAVIGAFLTPFVFRGGEISPLALTILFLYLALINGWILTVTKIKEWKWLNILAFSLTAMMLLTTIKYASENGYPAVFLTFSTIFFALFFYLPRKETSESYVIQFLNPFLYYFVLWFVTYKINPYIAGTLALILSAFYYYQGSLSEKKNSLELAWSFTSLAVLFLTIAIPVFFKTNWSTCAWAIEGAVIISLGKKENVLKILSLVLLGIAVFKMTFIDFFILETFPFLFNSIVTIAAVLVSAKFLSSQEEENKGLVGALNISGMLLVFWFTISGTLKFFDEFNHLEEMSSLVISVLWGIYALILFIAGIAKESTPARTAGFLMASLTITKVFLYDISSLKTIYRVLSFVVLGVILLIISFIYQKKVRRISDEE